VRADHPVLAEVEVCVVGLRARLVAGGAILGLDALGATPSLGAESRA
jgi:hypothetical protein